MGDVAETDRLHLTSRYECENSFRGEHNVFVGAEHRSAFRDWHVMQGLAWSRLYTFWNKIGVWGAVLKTSLGRIGVTKQVFDIADVASVSPSGVWRLTLTMKNGDSHSIGGFYTKHWRDDAIKQISAIKDAREREVQTFAAAVKKSSACDDAALQ